ncbi:nucleoside deaminase [Maribacter confluentis]|uniref:tRNA(Arg) A34 adenosine deaminase TadA n=2 Tax=Maribacter TaxID=252356 RepID=A0ABY1SGF9_9FLAO|nr:MULTISPECIES: nucleoside deaminase [Maribacter]MDO1511140.1 nucleoside deaminase [Maribacter confluentis]SNR45407.1 tRNA(Arg) A34 adenosine deaminase TadA [Maribacter sedimenticola]
MTEQDEYFMKRAIALAAEGMQSNAGGPFGAVVVKDGEIIAEGYNQVTSTNDPTAHAEVVAIRKACKTLNNFELTDCTIYTSCEPCPMCLGAIYWTRPKMVFFGCNREDAAAIDFDDQFIYDEIEKDIDGRQIKFVQLARKEALTVFRDWDAKQDKTAY